MVALDPVHDHDDPQVKAPDDPLGTVLSPLVVLENMMIAPTYGVGVGWFADLVRVRLSAEN